MQLYAVPQLPDEITYQHDRAPPHFTNIVHTFLDEQFPARLIGRGSSYITWPNTTRFFPCGGLLRTRSTGHQYVICQTYKKEFMLVSTMSHHRCFIIQRSRLNTGWTFSVPLMEAMLSFTEHKIKKILVFNLCSIGFIYRFILVQKL